MSDPVIVRPGKTIYTGPNEGGYQGRYGYGRYGRHHSFHACSNFFLRVLTAAATLAAIIVTLKATQTSETVYGYTRGRWRDYAGYRWFMIANAVIFVYSFLAVFVAFCSIFVRRGVLSYYPTAWLTFVVDFLLSSALMSAASVALAVYWINKKGQSTANWDTTCGATSRFCDYIQGAIIASFCGWAFLALSTLLAVSAIHYLARHRL